MKFAETVEPIVAVDTDGSQAIRLAIAADRSRLYRVVARISRGIYFIETNKVMAHDAEFMVFTPNSVSQYFQGSNLKWFRSEIEQPMMQIDEVVKAEGLFRYRFALLVNFSVTLIKVYDNGLWFFCMTKLC